MIALMLAVFVQLSTAQPTPCQAYNDLWFGSCVKQADEEWACRVPDETIKAAFDACQASKPQACEWVGPRLDGTDVRVCAGSVVAVRLGSDVRGVR